MKSGILVFAGPIASGKTTLAAGCARLLGCPKVSFSQFIRHTAQSRGLTGDRETLQGLGAELVAQDPRGLVSGTLALAEWKAGDSLVLEGLRHRKVFDLVKEIAEPTAVWLIYVDAALTVRTQRSELRDASSHLAEWNRHPVERGVVLLREAAALTVPNDRDVTDAMNVITDWLRHHD